MPKYPASLYPNSKALPRTPSGKVTNDGSRNTTPSKSPVLSTARRAESRSLKHLSSGDLLLVPKLGLVKPSPVTKLPQFPNHSNKVLPQLPKNTSKLLPQFSFMRDTSSSTLKKQATPNNSIKQPPAPHDSPSKYRSVSESHKIINHKKRPLRTISTSVPSITQSSSRARLVSNSISKPKPSDITNISYSNKTSEMMSNTYILNNPYSKQTEVTNNTDSESEESVPRPKKEHPYKALTGKTPDLTRTVRTVRISSEGKRRFESFQDLCRSIYEEQPDLFEDVESTDWQFTSTPPISPQDINTEVTNGDTPLSVYERGEILHKKDLYYIPNRPQQQQSQVNASINIRSYNDNYGFDDENGNYLVRPYDHINYRFEIDKVLGNGSFGNVVECSDHRFYCKAQNRNKTVAIKIIKNDLNWSLQAVYEIKMLKHLNDKWQSGPKNVSNSDPQYTQYYGNEVTGCPVLTYFDHFHFRCHMCIVTEVLSLNLYSLLEITKFRGISGNLLKDFSTKILQGLQFIHDNKIIHCDIKPENIMIKLPNGFNTDTVVEDGDFIVKIIDFGSSCFNDEISYSYIQSRFYRAPEVITGAKYNNMIDIWSFGCVIAELYSGFPLFPGKNELEQVGLIAEVLGAPSSALIQNQRNILVKSIRSQNAARNMFEGDFTAPKLNSVPLSTKQNIDEKSIKKTLLFTLFDLEGRMNLEFLNQRLQIASSSHAPTSSNFNAAPLRKSIRLSSKPLEVAVKSYGHTDEEKKYNQQFIKFLQLIFKWDPKQRLVASELLQHRFLHQ